MVQLFSSFIYTKNPAIHENLLLTVFHGGIIMVLIISPCEKVRSVTDPWIHIAASVLLDN